MGVFQLDLCLKKGFRSLYFENIIQLDSYFIHSYIILKYKSSSILGKINYLFCKLWPFLNLIFA